MCPAPSLPLPCPPQEIKNIPEVDGVCRVHQRTYLDRVANGLVPVPTRSSAASARGAPTRPLEAKLECLFELVFKSMHRVFDIHDNGKLVEFWQVKIRMNDVTTLR